MNDIKLRILIVDDEPQIRKFLRIGLTHAGYKTEEAEDGKSAIRLTRAIRPDMLVLDLGLPDIDGLEVIEQLRADGYLNPIIILSVRNDESDIVQALDRGADDYLTKPFGMEELMARLRSAQRRTVQTQTGGATEVSAGPVHIDLLRHEVNLDGKVVDLSPKEFALLEELAKNANRALTHRHLLQKVWGQAQQDNQQYLRVYMGQLRKKLSMNNEEPPYLRTLQGVGYIFDTTAVDNNT